MKINIIKVLCVVLVCFFMYNPLTAQQKATPIQLEVLTDQGHAIQEGASGFNVRIADKVWNYTHPDFRNAVHQAKPGWLRYFSGTMGDAFSAATGLYDLDYALLMDHQDQYFKGYKYTEVKGPHRLIDLYNLLGEVGGKLVVTVNAFTETPEMTYALAKFCHDNNIVVDAWQFCNEPYFYVPHRNRYWWNDGYDYALKMKPHADAIQKVFPSANLALNFTWDGVWDFMKEIHQYQEERGAYWNMFSKHSYATHVGKPGPFEAEIKRANTKIVDATSKKSMEDIENFTKEGIPMLITEFGVWNKPLNGIFSAIYHVEYILRQLSHPNAFLIGSHEISNKFRPAKNLNSFIEKAFSENRKIDVNDLSTGVVVNDDGYALKILHEATNQSDFIWPVKITGAKTVEGLKDTKVEAVYAMMFKGIYNEDFLVVTNRSGYAYEFEINKGGETIDKKVNMVSIASQVAKNKNVPNKEQSFLKGQVTVDPYSVSLIKWQHDREILPVATRVYRSEVTSNGVQLFWWKRKNADHYVVEYSNEKGGVSRLKTKSDHIEIKGLLKDDLYKIAVFVQVNGKRSKGSNIITHKIKIPEAPKVFKISRRNGTFTVFWNSVSNAAGYHVNVRDIEKDTTAVYDAKNVFGYRVSDLPYDRSFKVSVTAYNGRGESIRSREKSLTLKQNIPLPPRNIRAIETMDKRVYLTWVNQDTINEDVTYNIYRGTIPHQFELIKSGIDGNEFYDHPNWGDNEYFYTVKSETSSGECNFYPNIASVLRRDPSYSLIIENVEKNEDTIEVKVCVENLDLDKATFVGIVINDISYLNLEGKEYTASLVENGCYTVSIPKNKFIKNRRYSIKGIVDFKKRKILTLPPHNILSLN